MNAPLLLALFWLRAPRGERLATHRAVRRRAHRGWGRGVGGDRALVRGARRARRRARRDRAPQPRVRGRSAARRARRGARLLRGAARVFAGGGVALRGASASPCSCAAPIASPRSSWSASRRPTRSAWPRRAISSRTISSSSCPRSRRSRPRRSSAARPRRCAGALPRAARSRSRRSRSPRSDSGASTRPRRRGASSPTTTSTRCPRSAPRSRRQTSPDDRVFVFGAEPETPVPRAARLRLPLHLPVPGVRRVPRCRGAPGRGDRRGRGRAPGRDRVDAVADVLRARPAAAHRVDARGDRRAATGSTRSRSPMPRATERAPARGARRRPAARSSPGREPFAMVSSCARGTNARCARARPLRSAGASRTGRARSACTSPRVVDAGRAPFRTSRAAPS